MTQKKTNKIAKLAIAGAFLMALSCTIKITAFHLNMPIVAQWTNVVLNALIVYGCYELGKLVKLSLSHKLLCGTAIIGYILYSYILLTKGNTSDTSVSFGVLFFFMLTLVVSIWFLIDLMLRNLKEAEKDLEEMEKGMKE